MKKTKIMAFLLTCALLTGCGNAANNSVTSAPMSATSPTTTESTVSSETSVPVSSTQSSSAVPELTSSAPEQSESFKELRDSKGNAEFYEFIKTLGKVVQDDTNDRGTKTLIVLKSNGELAITYRTGETLTSADKAMLLFGYKTSSIVKAIEDNDIYKEVYFDWADSNGEKYAVWRLARLGANLHQYGDAEWFDDEVKAEYDKLMAGDYSAFGSVTTDN